MSWRDLSAGILEEFAGAAGFTSRRAEYGELPALAETYCPERRRLKYLRNREHELVRNRAYALRYYYAVLRDDPDYRARARAKAKAYYEAHRDRINARRRRSSPTRSKAP